MPQDIFAQRKKDVLSKKDKSSKQCWDKKIRDLCKKINSLDNYYTTSSCSGRIVLMVNQDKKESDLFFNVYHDLISFEQIKKDLNEIVKSYKTPPTTHFKIPTHSRSQINKELLMKNLGNDVSAENLGEARFGANKFRVSISERDKSIKFKLEPCALHVACRTLEDAQKFYNNVKLAGWKKFGVISFKNRFIVELNSTERLEFLIINNGKILVDDEFLKIIVNESNKKLKKTWEKIKRLERLLEKSCPKL